MIPPEAQKILDESNSFALMCDWVDEQLQIAEENLCNDLQRQGLATLYRDRAAKLYPWGNESMSRLGKIKKRGGKTRPRRVLLYSTPGAGKSTWAAMSPDPIFIDCEDGLDDLFYFDGDKRVDLEPDAFPRCKTYDDVMESVWELSEADHDYKTVVVDTIDWAENIITKKILKDAGVSSLNEGKLKFGVGNKQLRGEMSDLLGLLQRLNDKGMNVVLLAHSAVTKFEHPEDGSWDMYGPKLHKESVELIKEWATEIFFATDKVYTTKEKGSFGAEKTRATSAGEKILYTKAKPTFVAKCRLDMPAEVPFDMTKCDPFQMVESFDKELKEVM